VLPSSTNTTSYSAGYRSRSIDRRQLSVVLAPLYEQTITLIDGSCASHRCGTRRNRVWTVSNAGLRTRMPRSSRSRRVTPNAQSSIWYPCVCQSSV
jgi:hypothetical protein